MKSIQIGTRVRFNGCFIAATVLEIKGKTAVVDHCGEIVTKRISSLEIPVRKESYYNEQEIEHMTNQNFKEGDVIYAIIAEGENVIKRK